MANRMQDYIEEQPAVLSKLISGTREKTEELVRTLGDRTINRIFLIGSGSSNYASGMAKAFMEHVLGIDVIPVLPTEWNGFEQSAQDSDVYIAISQSGISTNTYALVKQLKENGQLVIGLTANPVSEIAKLCDQIADIGCGEENVGPKTKGVTATLMMLCLIGLETGKLRGTLNIDDYNRYYRILEKQVADMSGNIIHSRKWYEANCEDFLQERFTAVISDGHDYSIACEGTLKIVETLYRPACAYEFEEFLHGPHCLIGDRLRIILLLPPDGDAYRMLRFKEYAEMRGAAVYTISADDGETEDKNSLYLITGGERLLESFQKIIPFQVLCAYMSEFMGNDIDQPRFAGFSTAMGSKFS